MRWVNWSCRAVVALALALPSGPAFAQQPRDVVANTVILGAAGSRCVVSTGSGAPSGGNVCDVYTDITSGITYEKRLVGGWVARSTGSGTNGTLAKFTGTYTLGDSVVTEAAGVVSAAAILDSTTGTGTGIYRIGGSDVLRGWYSGGSRTLLSINDGGYAAVQITGPVGIGTNNPLVGTGLQVHDALFYMADSDVSHGVGTILPSAVYGALEPISGTDGGVALVGISEAVSVATAIYGIIGTDTPGNVTPPVQIIGGKRNATTMGALYDTEMVAQVLNYTTPLVSVLGNGHVGIGVLDPATALEINGTVNAETAADVGVYQVGGNAVITGGVGKSLLEINQGNYASVQIHGQVGIGTNAPIANSLLDVMDGWLVLTDSDVDHGATTLLAARGYAAFEPLSATAGGLAVLGISDTDATGAGLYGVIGSADPTDTTPALVLSGSKLNATTWGALGAAETVVQIQNNTTPVVTILGSGNVGIGWTSPGGRLEVRDTTTPQFVLAYNGSTYVHFSTSSGGDLTVAPTGSDLNVTARINNNLYSSSQFSSGLSIRAHTNGVEWGHSNTGGYGSTLGHLYGSGQPYLAFNASAGTDANTYKTVGIKGSIIQSNIAGGFIFGTTASASADNQSLTTTATLSAAGVFSATGGLTSGSMTIPTSIAQYSMLYASAANTLASTSTGLQWNGSVLTTSGDVAVNGGDITSTGDLTITPAGGDTIVVGNLGIGGTPASSRLEVINNTVSDSVVYAAFGPQTIDASTRAGGIQLQASAGAADSTWGIFNDNASPAGLTFEYLGARATAHLAGTTVLTLLRTGNVGIGTTAPNFLGHVLGASYPSFAVQSSGTTTDPRILLAVGGTTTTPTASWYITVDNSDSDKLKIGDRASAWGEAGDGDAITIDTAGKVGIGTTSPSYTFHVKKDVAGDWLAAIENDSTTTGNGLLVKNNSTGGYGVFTVMNGSSTLFRVNDTGRVGVRTATPDGQFVVKSVTGTDGIKYEAEASTNPLVWLTYGANTTIGRVSVYNAGTAKVMIDGGSAGAYFNSGNVGIGPDTTPDSLMDVQGTLHADGAITGDSTINVTGTATFGSLVTSTVTGHLIPVTTDTYDLGSADKLWRNSFISTMNALVFNEATQTITGGYFTVAPKTGTLGAAVGVADATIDFGQAMTVGDFVLVRAHDTSGTVKAEYILVGSLVSGTTYNVTRDLASAHVTDPAWAAGVPFMAHGDGDGRVDIIAADGKPRIVWTEQGATYNAQTHHAAAGNLNGYYGYATDVFGFGAGDYANESVTVDAVNGVRFHDSGTVVGQLNGATWTLGNPARITLNADGSGSLAGGGIAWATDGDLSVVGDVEVGTGGQIRSGATAYDTGTGWWLDYNAGSPRFRVGDPSGQRLTFASGVVEVVGPNSNALTAGSGWMSGEGLSANNGYKFAASATFGVYGDNPTGSVHNLVARGPSNVILGVNSVDLVTLSATAFTVGVPLALGANDLTMTGSLGATGARVTKGWFTDVEVTNAIAGSITGNAATVTNGVYTTGSYADPTWITSLAKSKVGLGNVEDTALSTWAGTVNVTTLGTVTTGTWNAGAVTSSGVVRGTSVRADADGDGVAPYGAFTSAAGVTALSHEPSAGVGGNIAITQGTNATVTLTAGGAVTDGVVKLVGSSGAVATFSPATADTVALGSGTLPWSDFALASGSVIDWNNGDVTLTHSANALALAGGSFDSAGDFSVATNKFTVAASDGDTYVAGELAVAAGYASLGIRLGAAVSTYGARIARYSDDVTFVGIPGATSSQIHYVLTSAGGAVAAFHGDGSVVVGAPTGGAKGAGTINAQAVYDDNVLLSDWVFDLYAQQQGAKIIHPVTGGPRVPVPARGRLYTIADVRATIDTERRLPWMPTQAEFSEARAVGGMVTRLWQGQEQQQLYVQELEARIVALEAAVAKLAKEIR